MKFIPKLFSKQKRANEFIKEQYMAMLRGGATTSGRSVSAGTALQFGAVFACIRIISETLGMLPLTLYRREDGNAKAEAFEHPLFSLMHDAPNDHHTSLVFRELMQAHLLAWGNCYAEVKRNSRAVVTSIEPLMPKWVRVLQDSDGNIAYEVKTSETGKPRILSPVDVLHIGGIGFNGVKGMSVLSAHKEAIGLGLAAEEFGASFFGNGATVSGVLEHPGRLSDNARKQLSESWSESYHGLSQSHKTAILEEGLKYQKIGLPPGDSQFLETRKFQIEEIARIYRVPPHMLAQLEKANFSTIEQMSLDFIRFSMMPWLVRWEQMLNKRLLLPSERGKYYFKFNVQGILRGDSKARAEFYKSLFNIGAISINEIRELEEMNPIESGDVHFVPLNMADLSRIDEIQYTKQAQAEAAPVKDKGDDSRAIYAPIVAQISGRLARRELKQKKDRHLLYCDVAHESFLRREYDALAQSIGCKRGIEPESVIDGILSAHLRALKNIEQADDYANLLQSEIMGELWKSEHSPEQ